MTNTKGEKDGRTVGRDNPDPTTGDGVPVRGDALTHSIQELVERLREVRSEGFKLPDVCREAADAIDALGGDYAVCRHMLAENEKIISHQVKTIAALRAERDDWQANYNRATDRLATLWAENERMRLALEKIAHPPSDIDAPHEGETLRTYANGKLVDDPSLGPVDCLIRRLIRESQRDSLYQDGAARLLCREAAFALVTPTTSMEKEDLSVRSSTVERPATNREERKVGVKLLESSDPGSIPAGLAPSPIGELVETLRAEAVNALQNYALALAEIEGLSLSLRVYLDLAHKRGIENERLRAALEKIADPAKSGIEECRPIARNALYGGEG